MMSLVLSFLSFHFYMCLFGYLFYFVFYFVCWFSLSVFALSGSLSDDSAIDPFIIHNSRSKSFNVFLLRPILK